MIDEMTYLWVSATTVREDMDQFNDTIKLFMSTLEEYQSALFRREKALDLQYRLQLYFLVP